MGKIKMLNRISIDGYFASSNEASFGMDWFVHDPEVDQAVHAIGGKMDTLILGAATYRLFERFWVPVLQDRNASPQLRDTAEELTGMRKIVFSTTLQESAWANTKIERSDVLETVRQLKQVNRSDILILGSGSIVRQLADEGLIDEYIFIVTPVVAGSGRPLFPAVRQLALTPVATQTFASGNVLLQYKLEQLPAEDRLTV